VRARRTAPDGEPSVVMPVCVIKRCTVTLSHEASPRDVRKIVGTGPKSKGSPVSLSYVACLILTATR
jgi:hypothetical protein